MEYSVKNVKTFKGPDFDGFNCSLYRGKTRIATVIDSGWGGDPLFEWLDRDESNHSKEEEKLREFVKTLPEAYPGIPMDMDILVTRLVSDYEENKWLKRHCKKKTVLRMKGAPAGQYQIISREYSPEFAEHLRKKEGNKLEEIVNERFL